MGKLFLLSAAKVCRLETAAAASEQLHQQTMTSDRLESLYCFVALGGQLANAKLKE